MSDNNFNPRITYINNTKIRVQFGGSCLKQGNSNFTQKAILKFYIAYEMNLWPPSLDSKFMTGNDLGGAVRLTENTEFDKYAYCGYGIAFDGHRFYALSDNSRIGKKAIEFRADISSSVHAGKTNKDNLILDTALSSEAEYSINFSKQHNKFCLSLHNNGSRTFLFCL